MKAIFFFVVVAFLLSKKEIQAKDKDILDQANIFEVLDQQHQRLPNNTKETEEKTKSTDILDKLSVFEMLNKNKQRDRLYFSLSVQGGDESYSSKISVMPRVSSRFYFPSIGLVYRSFNEYSNEVMSLKMEVQLNQYFVKLVSLRPYASIGQGYTYWQYKSLDKIVGDFSSFSTYLALGFDLSIFSGFNIFLQCKYDYYWQGYYRKQLARSNRFSHQVSAQYGIDIKL